MLDIADPQGLICGYQVDLDGTVRELAWQEMDAALASEDAVVWLHFNQVDARARDWIASCHRIPEHARQVLLGSDSHMRIEAVGSGLAGVVGDLHHEFADSSEPLDVLRLYLDKNCLISARRRPLTAVDKLRQQIGGGLKVRRPISIITQFLHHITDTLGDLILGLSGDVDRVEEAVLDGLLTQHGEQLGRTRRMAVRLRRHMIPQQHALIGLLSRLPPWIEDGEAADLRTAIERLGTLGHDLDLVQERARLLQEQASNHLMEATNKNLYILSIVTTIFLPMSLITGLFGMNLGGLPGQQDGLGFWYGLGLMFATGMATLVVLRMRKML